MKILKKQIKSIVLVSGLLAASCALANTATPIHHIVFNIHNQTGKTIQNFSVMPGIMNLTPTWPTGNSLPSGATTLQFDVQKPETWTGVSLVAANDLEINTGTYVDVNHFGVQCKSTSTLFVTCNGQVVPYTHVYEVTANIIAK